jgi:hypothetical protein
MEYRITLNGNALGIVRQDPHGVWVVFDATWRELGCNASLAWCFALIASTTS